MIFLPAGFMIETNEGARFFHNNAYFLQQKRACTGPALQGFNAYPGHKNRFMLRRLHIACVIASHALRLMAGACGEI